MNLEQDPEDLYLMVGVPVRPRRPVATEASSWPGLCDCLERIDKTCRIVRTVLVLWVVWSRASIREGLEGGTILCPVSPDT